MMFTYRLVGLFAVAGIIVTIYYFSNTQQSEIITWQTTLRQPNEPCHIDPYIPTWDEFYDFVESFRNECLVMKRFGGKDGLTTNDGSKVVCMEPKSVGPSNSSSCTVISVGINNEWSFDDAMANYGCQVYSFDPTMSRGDHQRSERVRFYHLGLAEANKMAKINNKLCPVTTYRGLLDRSEIRNGIIDYLKIDIEGSEFGFFHNVLNEDIKLLENVKQIGMEIHIGREAKLRDQMWLYIHRLLCAGFKQVASELNSAPVNHFKYQGRSVAGCYEILWINSRFL